VILSRYTLGRSFSVTAKATALVTWGIYSRVRNPIYVSGFIFIAGAILMIGRPEGLVLLLALIPMQIVRARREATVLEAKFGDAYREYAKAHGSEICCPGLPPPRCYHFSNEIQRRINESTMSTPTPTAAPKTIYVTRTGLPLSFKLEWPFRHATSGADFEVLHTVITLENSDGLRALVAVNLSVTLREELASLDPKDTEGPVINALRKEVDHHQTEFVKSGKLVPLPFSSRHYSFKLKKWTFGKATDEEIAHMVERKVYWQTRLVAETSGWAIRPRPCTWTPLPITLLKLPPDSRNRGSSP